MTSTQTYSQCAVGNKPDFCITYTIGNEARKLLL